MIIAYIEHASGADTNAARLSKSALTTISAALSMKQVHGHDKVVGLLIGGSGVAQAAAEAAFYGVDEVCFIEEASLEQYLALNYQAAFVKLFEQLKPQAVVGCSTSRGKDLFPRLAYALEAGQASDVLQFLPGGAFRRPMFAGNVIADVEITTAVKVVTIRTTAFPPASRGESAVSVTQFNVAGLTVVDSQRFVKFDTVASGRPELSEAEIVVSGGRAMKSAENFEQYIAPLADVLGAAIGASRAAVDSGYAPNDWQVGQTGKIVAPSLYIAVGISGAIQHLAGMKDAKTIVAINTDPEAPIFEVADYGLVADLYQVLPELTAAIRQAKA